MNKISDDDLYFIIIEILSGEKIVRVEPLPDYYVFKYPSYREKLYSNILEKETVNKYILEGYLSETELDESIMAEFFSSDDQDQLDEIQEKLQGYNIIIKKRHKDSEQYQIDLQKIKDLQKEEQNLLYKKSSCQQVTAEFKAREDKLLYLLSKCTFYFDGGLVWNNVNEMMNSFNKIDALYNLLSDFIRFYYGYSVSVIRQIARNNLWKNIYKNAKRGMLVPFNTKTEELSMDQLNLMSWSIYYADIAELSYNDRPDDDLLEDDKKLDIYIEELSRKLKAEQTNISTNKLGDNDSQHVIVTAESANYVKFHKDGLYSDTSLITDRSKENSKTYNEVDEFKKIKQKLRRAK
jgi:hypothetical protein